MALSFGRLTVEKLPIDDASLKLRGQGGVISLDDMRGGGPTAAFNAKANLDVRQDSAVLTATKHIANVPVERLLEAQGKKPPVKGCSDSTPTSAPAATARSPGSTISTAAHASA